MRLEHQKSDTDGLYRWGYELVMPEPTIKYLSVSASVFSLSYFADSQLSVKQKVKSIEGMVLNFLTLFALMSGGVREIMPFVRYIAQYVDLEWDNIKAKVSTSSSTISLISIDVRGHLTLTDLHFLAAAMLQDKGKGVVCAATWLMPAALVPRAWDFPAPDPPPDADPKDPSPSSAPRSTADPLSHASDTSFLPQGRPGGDGVTITSSPRDRPNHS